MPWATARSPSWRWWRAAIAGSRPMARSWCTARGVSPSPQVLSRGKALRSSTQTSWPALASQKPAAAPAGPPPMTRTSCRSVAMGPEPRAPAGRRRRPGSAAEVGLGDAGRLGQLAEARLGQGHLARGDGAQVGVVLVGLGDVLARELPLVEDDLGDLLVGERGPGRHQAAAAHRLLGGAVGGGGPALGAEPHPGGMVAPVGEGLDHSAVREGR